MKKLLLTFMMGLIALLSFSAYAESNHYVIFVDAGSSGSRVHIFQYQLLSNMPIVHEVFADSTQPGLSSFADNPTMAGASLKTILDSAALFIKNNGGQPHVHISVMGTAGMRLLSDQKQKGIYDDVTQYINAHYLFTISAIQTIPGTMEGLYGWLDINYLQGNFQNRKPTVGSIDVGGASAEIAFATHDLSKPQNETELRINNLHYHVFSKSFLGLGQDQIRAKMVADTNAKNCFPTNYGFNANDVGQFDRVTCSSIYSNLIESDHIMEQVAAIPSQDFIATSAVYYTFSFLGVDKTPNQSTLENKIQTICTMPWDQLQANYPNEKVKYLSAYCANGSYLDQLLFGAFKVNKLTVTDHINQNAIDWPLGAAFYYLLKK